MDGEDGYVASKSNEFLNSFGCLKGSFELTKF